MMNTFAADLVQLYKTVKKQAEYFTVIRNMQ